MKALTTLSIQNYRYNRKQHEGFLNYSELHAKYDALLHYADKQIKKGSGIPPEVRSLFLISRYVGEVNNGGHSQYYYNHSQNLDIPETIESLEEMGYPHLAEILNGSYQNYLSQHTRAPETKPNNAEIYIDFSEAVDFQNADNQFFELDIPDPLDSALDNYGEKIDKWVDFGDAASLDLHGFSPVNIELFPYEELESIAQLSKSEIDLLDKLIMKVAGNEWRWIFHVSSDAVKLWDKDFDLRFRFATYRAEELIRSKVLESEEQLKIFENGNRKMVTSVRLAE